MKKTGSEIRINIPDISESLIQIFCVKNTENLGCPDPDPGSGAFLTLDPGSG
jgi:hypothetical protein